MFLKFIISVLDKKGNRDKFRIIIHVFPLSPFLQDGSNEGSQHIGVATYVFVEK